MRKSDPKLLEKKKMRIWKTVSGIGLTFDNFSCKL